MRTRLLPDGTRVAIFSSHRNQDLGIGLIVATLCIALPGLFALYLNDESLGLWLALLPVVLLLEFALIHIPKRVLVTGTHVEVQDGRTIGADLNGTTEVILDNQLRSRPQWNVQIVSEGARLLVDARPENVLELRACAEFLARALRCPLVDASSEDESVAIAPEDLDMPIAPRLRKYPTLMGASVARPGTLSLHYDEGPVRRFSGAATLPALVLAALVFCGGVLAVSMLPGGFGRPSMLQQAMESGDFAMYLWTAVLTLLMLIAGMAQRWEMEVDGQEVRLARWLLQWKLHQAKLAWTEIEEVHVTRRHQHYSVNVIADRKVLTVPAHDAAEAAWLAWELRMLGIQAQP